MVTSATADQEVLGTFPGSGKVLLGFSLRNFSEAITESGFVIDNNMLASYYMGLKNITGEMRVYFKVIP